MFSHACNCIYKCWFIFQSSHNRARSGRKKGTKKDLKVSLIPFSGTGYYLGWVQNGNVIEIVPEKTQSRPAKTPRLHIGSDALDRHLAIFRAGQMCAFQLDVGKVIVEVANHSR